MGNKWIGVPLQILGKESNRDKDIPTILRPFSHNWKLSLLSLNTQPHVFSANCRNKFSKKCEWNMWKNPPKNLYEEQYRLYFVPRCWRQGCRRPVEHVIGYDVRPGQSLSSMGISTTQSLSTPPLQGMKGGRAAPSWKPEPLGLQFLSLNNLSTKYHTGLKCTYLESCPEAKSAWSCWLRMSGEPLYIDNIYQRCM